MAKERVIKQMTEEQWKRLRDTPGVEIRVRPGGAAKALPPARLRVSEPITAAELINDDEDETPAS